MAGSASGTAGGSAVAMVARRARRRRRDQGGAGGGQLFGLLFDRAGHVLEIVLERGDARGEPLAVGGQVAQLGGETLGLGRRLGLRRGRRDRATARAGSLRSATMCTGSLR